MEPHRNNITDQLRSEVNEGYTDLAKWLIGLATGAIVFSIKLTNPSIPSYLNILLKLGLGSLVFSILSGVIFVRLRIDSKHYNLCGIRVDDRINELNNESQENTQEINRLQKISRKAKRNFRLINILLRYLLPLHHWTFIFGISLIAIFGILTLG